MARVHRSKIGKLGEKKQNKTEPAYTWLSYKIISPNLTILCTSQFLTYSYKRKEWNLVRSLRLLWAAFFNGETCPVESFGFDKIDRLVDSRRSLMMILVVVASFRAFRGLKRRVRLQVQIQVLNLVKLATGTDDLVTLKEVVDLSKKISTKKKKEKNRKAPKLVCCQWKRVSD